MNRDKNFQFSSSSSSSSSDSESSFRSRRRRALRKGIFVFPSILTAAALFSGFYSIIATLNSVINDTHEFKQSVFAIILAAVFDSLDGRMARLMHAESEFGSHFDSISDVVSFGVAPSVLIYSMALAPLGRLGWLGAFMFLACAAIRLARFNVLSNAAPSKKFFKGLSSPVAAGGLVITSYTASDTLTTDIFRWMMFGTTIFLSMLMVSNVRFRSFKDLDIKRSPLQIFLLVILLGLLIVSLMEVAMMALFVIYLVAGLIEELILFRRRRRSDPNVPFLPFGERDFDENASD